MIYARYAAGLWLLILLIVLSWYVGSAFSFEELLQVVGSEVTLSYESPLNEGLAYRFETIELLYAVIPRSILAILVGGGLGLAGSLLQQLTQNPLVSPMTLGASSGAWLALVCLSLGWPTASMMDVGQWVALTGAMAASSLVFWIAGRQGVSGISIVLSGMAVHMLLGALAVTLVILNDQSVRSLFIWGAGDLTQTDWLWVEWLLPKAVLVLLVPIVAAKPLMLLKMGESNAEARGLSLLWTFVALGLAALWLVSISITAVGLIGFVALMAPNLARALGVRQPLHDMYASVLIGALILLGADIFAQILSQWSLNLVPSGTAVAIMGAPYLVLLMKQGLSKERYTIGHWASQPLSLSFEKALLAVLCVLLVVIGLSLFYSPAYLSEAFSWPSAERWGRLWPKVLGAFAAGAGMAVAGMMLQSLIRNPLASPDILGLSAGATLALVLTSLAFNIDVQEISAWVAFLGSLSVMGLLLWLGRKHRYAPGLMILMGIAITALLDALVNFVMAKGGEEVFSLLGWLSGSTYRLTAKQAVGLAIAVGLLMIPLTALQRWIKLLSIDDAFAEARGLNTDKARWVLLVLAALFCALSTSVLGPIAFIGLMAPHAARLLGARGTIALIWMSALLGGLFMVMANGLGQVMLYPTQIPAGTLASLIGGASFVVLIGIRNRQSTLTGA